MVIIVITILIGVGFILYSPRLSWIKVSQKYLLGGFCLWGALVFSSAVFEEKLIRATGLGLVAIAGLLFLIDLCTTFLFWMSDKIAGIFQKTHRVPSYAMELWNAMEQMAAKKVGALIVIQRKRPLRPHMKGGMPFDAEIKSEILTPLFLTTSPVHDGALVVHKGRIQTVKGILPIASLSEIAPSFGTRHRAAIGITEKTDAIALVVSEERGEISIAYRGCLAYIRNKKEFIRVLSWVLKGRNFLRLRNVDFTVTTKILEDLA